MWSEIITGVVCFYIGYFVRDWHCKNDNMVRVRFDDMQQQINDMISEEIEKWQRKKK